MIDIDLVKARLSDPRTVLGELGLLDGSKPLARGVMIRCPAHHERTASCAVRTARDGTIAVRCHACGWSADVIGLVGIVHGLSTGGAMRAAAELAGVDQTAPDRVGPRPTRRDRVLARLDQECNRWTRRGEVRFTAQEEAELESLTPDELQGLHDELDALWRLARLEEEGLAELLDEVADAWEALHPQGWEAPCPTI